MTVTSYDHVITDQPPSNDNAELQETLLYLSEDSLKTQGVIRFLQVMIKATIISFIGISIALAIYGHPTSLGDLAALVFMSIFVAAIPFLNILVFTGSMVYIINTIIVSMPTWLDWLVGVITFVCFVPWLGFALDGLEKEYSLDKQAKNTFNSMREKGYDVYTAIKKTVQGLPHINRFIMWFNIDETIKKKISSFEERRERGNSVEKNSELSENIQILKSLRTELKDEFHVKFTLKTVFLLLVCKLIQALE